MNFQEMLASPMTLMFAMLAIFYFILFRPQQQRAKQLRTAVDNLRRGDVVVTSGGILGKVVKATSKDETEILVEIADNVQVKVLKATLSDVRARNADKPADKE